VMMREIRIGTERLNNIGYHCTFKIHMRGCIWKYQLLGLNIERRSIIIPI